MVPPAKGRRATTGPSPRDIVRAELLREIEVGEEFAFERFERIHPLGVLILRPLTYALRTEYKRKGGRNLRTQIEVLLAAAEARGNGHSPAEVRRRYFGRYLRHDLLHQRASRGSGHFGALRGLLGELFGTRVDMLARLLDSRGKSYEELARNAFRTRKQAEGVLARQFAIHDEILRLFEEDPRLLRIPGPVQNHVLHVVRELYDYSKERISGRLDEIFN